MNKTPPKLMKAVQATIAGKDANKPFTIGTTIFHRTTGREGVICGSGVVLAQNILTHVYLVRFVSKDGFLSDLPVAFQRLDLKRLTELDKPTKL